MTTQKADTPEPPAEEDFYDGPETLEAEEGKADFDADETNAKEGQ